MDYKVMEQLLDKYFEGETSLQEEKQIRDYFQREKAPESLRPYQPLFQHLAQEQSRRLGEDFDRKLLQRLEEARPQAKIRRLPARSWALRIAAAVALVLGLWWAYLSQNTWLPAEQQAAAIDWSRYEVQSPEDAFRLTSTALLKASTELNHGASTAAHEMDKLKKVGKYFK